MIQTTMIHQANPGTIRPEEVHGWRSYPGAVRWHASQASADRITMVVKPGGPGNGLVHLRGGAGSSPAQASNNSEG